MTSGIRRDLTGTTHGRLTVTSVSGTRKTPNGSSRLMWNCTCSCGTEVEVWSVSLINGVTRSCGCLARELSSLNHSTHGQRHSPTYTTWRGMMDRCRNPNNPRSANYMARGIAVCNEWSKFEVFLHDMGERPEGLTLERVDNDKGYNKTNCKWASSTEQARNTTRSVLVTWRGTTRNICDWATDMGITQQGLRIRIRRWGLDRAMTTPVAHHTHKVTG